MFNAKIETVNKLIKPIKKLKTDKLIEEQIEANPVGLFISEVNIRDGFSMLFNRLRLLNAQVSGLDKGRKRIIMEFAWKKNDLVLEEKV